MNKLDIALGYIDGKLLDEADSCTKKPGKLKLIPLIAACAVLLAVGAAAFGIRYFAPGIGIVDGGVRVLASEERVMLGDAVVEAVMMSDLGGSAELSCWIYREKELEPTPDMISEGRAPDGLTSLTVVIDGREYPYTEASLSTVGFSYYNFSGIPVSEELTLRCLGDEVRITLSEAAASDYASVGFGKNTLTLIPVSEERGLYQAEIKDDFAAKLARAASTGEAYVYLAAKDGSGALNFPDGPAMIYGAACSSLAGIEPGDPAELSELALLYVDYIFRFNLQSELPEVKTSLPAEGGSTACPGVLFENDDLKISAVSVLREKDSLFVETAFEGGENFPESLISGFSVSATAYVRLEDGLREVFFSDGIPVYRKFYDSDVTVELGEGDEIVLRLDSVWMMYNAKGTSKTEFSPNLGSVKLK